MWLRTNFVFCLLGAVGVLQSTGLLLRVPALQLLGRMSAASPLPLVFNSYNGVDYWAQQFELELEFTGNEPIHRIELNAETFAALPGPHPMHMFFVAPLAFSTALPRPFWEGQIVYAICGSGRLADALQLPLEKRVRNVYLTVFPPRYSNAEIERFAIACPQG